MCLLVWRFAVDGDARGGGGMRAGLWTEGGVRRLRVLSLALSGTRGKALVLSYTGEMSILVVAKMALWFCSASRFDLACGWLSGRGGWLTGRNAAGWQGVGYEVMRCRGAESEPVAHGEGRSVQCMSGCRLSLNGWSGFKWEESMGILVLDESMVVRVLQGMRRNPGKD